MRRLIQRLWNSIFKSTKNKDISKMETWSDSPVIEEFKVKFFLDTNILIFLIDESYPSLTISTSLLNDSVFATLLSSRYVVFEFVGARKKEHFLREVFVEYQRISGELNISTFLKNSDSFKAYDVDYNEINDSIKTKVEDDLERVTNDFGIIYSDNMLHDGLLQPTFDICLFSKISKEDSLVLASALLPENGKPDKDIHILTNDAGFTTAFNELDFSDIFEANNLNAPEVESIRKVFKLLNSTGENIDLTKTLDEERLKEFWEEKMVNIIRDKNAELFLGHTFLPDGANFPNDVLCFKLNEEKELNNNVYITIVSNNLSFIYSTKHQIEQFWNNEAITVYPYSADVRSNISFKIMGEDGQPLSADIMEKLQEAGNMVFIHPDTI